MNQQNPTLTTDYRIKKTTFIFTEACLIIMQKSWFQNKEIKRLNYNSISDIKLVTPRSENSYFPKLILKGLIKFFISFFTFNAHVFNNQFKKHILINYLVGEDEANYRLDINISKKEFEELTLTVKQYKE